MLRFMESHKALGTGRFTAPDGAKQKQRLLFELASILNSMASGVSKTPEKWYKDWRSDVKSKQALLRREMSKTGGGQINPKARPLTPLEERLIAFLGPSCAYGHLEVADALCLPTVVSGNTTNMETNMELDANTIIIPLDHPLDSSQPGPSSAPQAPIFISQPGPSTAPMFISRPGPSSAPQAPMFISQPGPSSAPQAPMFISQPGPSSASQALSFMPQSAASAQIFVPVTCSSPLTSPTIPLLQTACASPSISEESSRASPWSENHTMRPVSRESSERSNKRRRQTAFSDSEDVEGSRLLALLERQVELQERSTALSERQMELQERNTAVSERQVELQERDSERDAVFKERFCTSVENTATAICSAMRCFENYYNNKHD